MEVYVEGKRIKLLPNKSIGKGGEADVYDIGGEKALKVFKTPDHPDYQGNLLEQLAAQKRIDEHQEKLRAFPVRLPSRIVAPQDLATDRAGKQIAGYTMRLLQGALPLLQYADRNFRQAGNGTVISIFRDLHQTVSSTHSAHIVIGDFNDLNVLVCGTEAYLIDADSFQFGKFLCRVFTTRFADPLLCKDSTTGIVLMRPHSADSDWYAFAVMLMECLLFVDPYGGVYRPNDPSKRIPHDLRPLHRITVFHPEVRYPKPAIPYSVLPDDLLHYFHLTFEKDHRGEFPQVLLEQIRWTKCVACSTEHARSVCPFCSRTAPAAVKRVTTVRGQVSATVLFRTRGLILCAAVQQGELRWLYHEDGQFKRETGQSLFGGDPEPQMRFRLCGQTTLIAKQGQVLSLTPGKSPTRLAVDSYGALPMFDASESCRYWLQNGRLLRDGTLGPEHIGDVLERQTLFWVGPAFGFGFYRAANLQVAFVFDARKRGINDSVKLSLHGKLIDATCAFTQDRCWFFAAVQESGKTIHQCQVLRSNGSVEATAQSEKGDGSWLSTLRGKCASGNSLFAATDEGIVRLEPHDGQIMKTKEFPDTEPFVDSGCFLLAGKEGLYVVNQHEIRLLTIL